MKKIKYISILFCAVSLFLASACTDKLEKLPDSRMTLNSPEDVSRLLVTAYPSRYSAPLLELYSDNTDYLISPTWQTYSQFEDEAYEWKDIKTEEFGMDPNQMYYGFYGAIAAANEALDFIDKQSDKSAYQAQMGEAYVCRAFSMFHIANIFCQAYNPSTADTELGMPYPTKPETSVHAHYERGTLAETYKKIEEDLERGLQLLGSNYAQPKFHFTPDAANAFAARFYLYYQKYDKAIEAANRVLGDNPVSKLRNWAEWKTVSVNLQWAPDAYISTNENSNLLLLSVHSFAGFMFGNTSYSQKYNHGEVLAQTETLQAAGPWGQNSTLNYQVFSNSSISKYIMRKQPQFMESESRLVPYSTYSALNTDETLMVRAEAYALSGQYDKALADVNSELQVFSSTKPTLTLQGIRDFYSRIAYYTPQRPTVKKRFNAPFTIEAETQEPLLQCILQLKRLITIHDGLRMQDIKRYGITIYRRPIRQNGTIEAPTDSMKVGDLRLAIQLPEGSIRAGATPNPRK